ncbi:N-acetylmuramoyl-L-alanine amidase [Streptomyces sp. CRN 30]|uniref:N-acetylmuramoyl-L-alanine amidase n=1 Tax=Streptomyces sp. CRN 30 TaxID=3075613 RepID=UPI002A805E32|nr:N-acetylmuramoyl-L-alanine amidase [Streptomyces sp. CRN 30]
MRRSPTAPRPATASRRAHRTAAVTVASAALLLPLLGAAPSGGPARDPADGLQDAFAAAAARYGVPPGVLLGVSYLQSRWDAHGGAPSVTGGYGPMHLTDARAALAGSPPHHSAGTEDPRGDDSRPMAPPTADVPRRAGVPDRLETLARAAALTGLPAAELRSDVAANVAGGAALLAAAQRDLGGPPSDDPADWYAAVARFSGADDRATAAGYADEVFRVLRTGQRRTTDAGQRVTLTPDPGLRPDTARLARAGLRTADAAGTECPATVSCEWIPAPRKELGGGKHGNHDVADRPAAPRIEYIVVHDTEETWDRTLQLVQDPAYVAWHYTLRSTDGHIAQHVKTKDVGWHAGNWYVNSTSIGLEHEGFLARPDAWYTEAMYRSSARLVRYLAARYDIPLDRRHVLGHDTVPGAAASTIPAMHTDPGPYWDWQHYFALLGEPFEATAGAEGGLVTIAPAYAEHRPPFTGCTTAGTPCAAHGSSAVRLHTRPAADAPLVQDIGLRPGGGRSTVDVHDIGSRVSAGQQYAVAGRAGDWTAIWYLGQKAWFQDPKGRPTALPASGPVVAPRPGLTQVPVYGRAYPERGAYPAGVPVQPVSPLPYRLLAGQRYAVGGQVPGEYFYAPTLDPARHRVVTGKDKYYEIQFGHRVAFVRAADVQVLPSAP